MPFTKLIIFGLIYFENKLVLSEDLRMEKFSTLSHSPPAKILSTLTILEIKGIIRETKGKIERT